MIERCQRRFDRFDLQGLKLPTVTLWPLLDPKSVIPAERANELVVREGIPFREAYRRVGAELAAAKPEK